MIGSVTDTGGRTVVVYPDRQMVEEVLSGVTRGSLSPGVQSGSGVKPPSPAWQLPPPAEGPTYPLAMPLDAGADAGEQATTPATSTAAMSHPRQRVDAPRAGVDGNQLRPGVGILWCSQPGSGGCSVTASRGGAGADVSARLITVVSETGSPMVQYSHSSTSR